MKGVQRAAATALAALAIGSPFACGQGTSGGRAVTFNRDIAPIVFTSCAPCHRPGEATPFDLLDYDDVVERAREIVEVTHDRYMPPWLPDTPEVDYRGERRLTGEQIELFASWYEGGLVEGQPEDLPDAPVFPEGWQLGEPDLAVGLEEPHALPAEGTDVIRNFVIGVPLTEPRWVRAVEIRPGEARTVHHAILKRDRTGRSRKIDARDQEPGFPGMELGAAEYPEGQIIVWTPGMAPDPGDPALAWRLEPGDDLVLQLHMVPTGKVEAIRPRIGFHFTDQEPTVVPSTVVLRNDHIDIPPGDEHYTIEDSFTLPVPVRVLGVYPHAHYLGRRLEIWADVPSGGKTWLLRIPAWDFNWQGMYHLAQPIELEVGSTVRMKYVYDNSSRNPRNPNVPPVRVRIGNRSSDEMATLALQVVTENPAASQTLELAQSEEMLRDDPRNPAAHYNLGVIHARAGDLPRAIEHYRQALALDPEDAQTHFLLAGALYRSDDVNGAIEQYTLAVSHDPALVEARLVLGFLLTRRGELALARSHLERAIALDPRSAKGHLFLGEVLERQGDLQGAAAAFRSALELDPDLAEAARALARVGG